MLRGLYKLVVPVVVIASLGGCGTLANGELRTQEKPDVVIRAGKVYEQGFHPYYFKICLLNA